jgi:Ca2+-transporting ATPase
MSPEAERINGQLAERGLRVLAVAIGHGTEEEELELLGLCGMADPPRSEAIEAVAAARAAGVRTVMITGDHPRTAEAIARELGILGSQDDPREVVHARASPEQKLTIVREWKRRNAIVAMTGDGVNDAPALREAHIGIAMGRTGTEVTREASDMVLADDNYASIVAAVHEGRGIFDNIRKTLVYLLAGNASELLVMLGAAAFGLPLPLLPLQLLWINLVTDSLPALALVTDPVDPNAMRRPPRRPEEPMLGRVEWRQVAGAAAIESCVTLGAFVWALETHGLFVARSLVFSVLVFAELFRAFAARSPTRVLFQVGVFTNLRLLGVVGLQTLLHLAIQYWPATQELFRVGGLTAEHSVLAVLLGLVPVTVLEVRKLISAARSRARAA